MFGVAIDYVILYTSMMFMFLVAKLAGRLLNLFTIIFKRVILLIKTIYGLSL
jgi:hypothetical protein